MRRIGHKLGVALGVGALALALLAFSAGTERAQVPWVLGNSEAQAVKRIEGRDLHAEVLKRAGGAHRLSDRFKVQGQVVFQEYRGGITLPRGSVVRLMVYKDGRRHHPAHSAAAGEAQAASGRSSSRSRTTTARAGVTSSTSPSDSSTNP